MSSISSDNRRDDTIKKIKEESYAREAENNRKHKAELRNMTEQYQEEVEALKNSHSDQVQQMNEYIKSRLTKQEQVHQDQMQEIRDVFSKQLKKKSEDQSSLLDAEKEVFKTDIKREKDQAEAQRVRMEKEFSVEMAKKDQVLRNYTLNARDESEKIWEERKKKLDVQKTNDINNERKGREQVIQNLNNQLTNVRRSSAGEIKRVKTQNEFERQRLMNNYKENVEAQERLNNSVHKAMTEDFQYQQSLEKDKYRKKIDQNETALNLREEDFKERLSQRVNDEINSLKNENSETKKMNSVDRQNLMRAHDTEIKHLMDNYEDRLIDQDQKLQQVQKVAQEELQSDLGKAVATRDREIKQLNEDHERDKSLAKLQNIAHFNQYKNAADEREMHLSKRAETKVNMANEHLRQSTDRLQNFYNNTLELIRDGFEEKLASERERHIQERSEVENKLGSKLREQERLLTHQIEKTALDFDEKIQTLKDFYETELRKAEIDSSKQLNDREKAYKLASKNDNLRFETQLNQVKEMHNKEIEDMDRRHKHEMNQLVQKTADRLRRKA